MYGGQFIYMETSENFYIDIALIFALCGLAAYCYWLNRQLLKKEKEMDAKILEMDKKGKEI